MTDSAKTPQNTIRNPETVIMQFLAAARTISDAERLEGVTVGGVTINYAADGSALTGTFTLPLQRTVNSDGSESLKPKVFIK